MMTPTPEWFGQYMSHVANNVKNRDGEMRFSYMELRTALTAVEHADYDHVPRSVMDLFAKIIGVLPKVELSDRQQVTLMLALLNCHMAYSLLTGYLLQEDPSIEQGGA